MLIEIWQQCISRLETEISEQQLNTWILPLQAEQELSVLKLLAPNRFVMDWVRKHFLERIIELVSGLDDSKSISVNLSIGSQTKPISPAKESGVNQPIKKLNKASTFSESQLFSNFVEGKSNQLARAASIQISSTPGSDYNPLYIYGGVGLGKTHLMHAIGNQIRQRNPESNILYVNCERFVSDMVKALQHSKMNEFKNYYRSLDALLVDDIQFLADKNRSQEEFFHTFNSLYESKAQMVITCDRFPKEIEGLEDRIRSRLGWGLAVDIKPADLETRVAILNSKAEQANVSVPDDVAFFIAERFKSNIRELEGALKRVIAHAHFTGQRITQDFARQALKELLAVQDKPVTIEKIQKQVATYYKIRVADLLSSRRTRSITRPRQLAMSITKELTRHSLPEIGGAFGGRDHTTVLHACRKIVELRNVDNLLDEDYENIVRLLT
ncbi:chromosomal replication initiator protein DnaA, partial [uncultured Paraglaciecola sp.]|uniref:chromosomal replication initiator protein DnaA n=1 Tax=uncultured Paraglaciecola sp. TaxID=1765024 RepID=UPI0025DDBC13